MTKDSRVKVLVWTFGFKLNAKQRARRGGVEGHHGGCWINDWDCGDPDCTMARRDPGPTTRYLGGTS